MTIVHGALRAVTAGLVAAVAAIHLDLFAGHGYRHIPTIGTLFLLNGIAGSALTVSVVAIPRSLLSAATAGLAAAFAAGTLAALIVSLNTTLFGFHETAGAPLVTAAIAVETACLVTGTLLAIVTLRSIRSPATASRTTARVV